MAELDVLEDVSIVDQAREILLTLLNDRVLADDVKDRLRERMAERPHEPDQVLLEHLVSCRKRSQVAGDRAH
jgi:hypothetical protein